MAPFSSSPEAEGEASARGTGSSVGGSSAAASEGLAGVSCCTTGATSTAGTTTWSLATSTAAAPLNWSKASETSSDIFLGTTEASKGTELCSWGASFPTGTAFSGRAEVLNSTAADIEEGGTGGCPGQGGHSSVRSHFACTFKHVIYKHIGIVLNLSWMWGCWRMHNQFLTVY